MCSFTDQRFDAALDRAVAAQLPSNDSSGSADLVTEADLAALPTPVATYLRRCGVVGRPHVHNAVIDMHATLYRAPDQPPMETPVLQVSFVHPPTRLFLLHTHMFGLPVHGVHAYNSTDASMDIRLLGLLPVVRESGQALHRAESVTVLNDWCIMMPAALLDSRLTWKEQSERQVDVAFRSGGDTVHASLEFDVHGDLVNFSSEDRHFLDADGFRWTTPLRFYRDFGGVRLASQGDAIWHYSDRELFTYGTFTLRRVRYNVPADELPHADQLRRV